MTTYPKMDPAIKEDWVEALRSGDFVQTDGVLDQDDAQCCLGVLCDILDLPWRLDAFGRRVYGSDLICWLPDSVLRTAGIGRKAQCKLMQLNDDHKATFPEIADWIEAHL